MKIKKRKYRRTVGGQKLRAKRDRKSYKDLDSYLNAVYSNNQEYLNSHMDVLGDTRTKRTVFKQEVIDLLNVKNPETGKRYSVNQAIDMVQRSTTVRTRSERHFETLMSEISEQSQETFRKIRKELGWKERIDSRYSHYLGAEGNSYYYEYYNPNTGVRKILKISISPKAGTESSVDILDYDDKRVNKIIDKQADRAANDASRVVEEVLKKYGGR